MPTPEEAQRLGLGTGQPAAEHTSWLHGRWKSGPGNDLYSPWGHSDPAICSAHVNEFLIRQYRVTSEGATVASTVTYMLPRRARTTPQI